MIDDDDDELDEIMSEYGIETAPPTLADALDGIPDD